VVIKKSTDVSEEYVASIFRAAFYLLDAGFLLGLVFSLKMGTTRYSEISVDFHRLYVFVSRKKKLFCKGYGSMRSCHIRSNIPAFGWKD
jgi:hypothetical protein